MNTNQIIIGLLLLALIANLIKYILKNSEIINLKLELYMLSERSKEDGYLIDFQRKEINFRGKEIEDLKELLKSQESIIKGLTIFEPNKPE